MNMNKLHVRCMKQFVKFTDNNHITKSHVGCAPYMELYYSTLVSVWRLFANLSLITTLHLLHQDNIIGLSPFRQDLFPLLIELLN